MTPPPAAAEPLDDGYRRPGVLGALASALPDRGRRGDPTELRVVRPASRRRRSWQVGTLVGGLLFLAMFMIVGAQTLIVQRQQHIDDVNTRMAEAAEEAERLKVELAELQSPERIKREATDRLGMVQAPSPVYLQPHLDDDPRAAEVPPTTPPTTAATTPTTSASSSKGTTPTTGTASKSTTPTTTAKSSTPTTSATTKGTTPTTTSGTGGTSAGTGR